MRRLALGWIVSGSLYGVVHGLVDRVEGVGAVAEVLRAFKFALDSARPQLEALARHAGASRWAFNHAPAARKTAHERWRAEVDALIETGVLEAERRRLLPCWYGHLRDGRPGRMGVFVDANTRLVIAAARLVPGATADAHAGCGSGLGEYCAGVTLLGDGAYLNSGMVVPRRKRPGRALLKDDEDASAEHRRVCARVEHVIGRM